MPAIERSLAVGDLPVSNGLPDNIFQHLGQYSPWFAAESNSSSKLPEQCSVTFVSQLERHGSRYPTGGAYRELRKTLREIAKHLRHVSDADDREQAFDNTDEAVRQDLDPALQWLRTWTDSKKDQDGGLRNRLGNSELTPYGQYEAFSSGRRFSEQYAHLFDANEVDINYDLAGVSHNEGFASYFCSSQRSLPVSVSLIYSLLDYVGRQGCQALGYFPRSLVAVPRRPFVRASGADRVVASSRFWLQGFATPRKHFEHASPESAPWPQKGRPAIINPQKSKKPHRPIRGLPEPDVIISEARKANKLGEAVSNNTLDVYTCLNFEHDHRDNARSEASRRVSAFTKNATSSIRKRLARQLGARSGGSKDRRGERLHLSSKQIQQLFSLCAFDTVTRLDPYGLIAHDKERNQDAVSPFCDLFDPAEFKTIYEISTNLEKDYGFAAHQPLHKALATSWLRELLARLEERDPVLTPPASINTTLDTSTSTFPLPAAGGPRAFVDFTHDNQLAPIIASLGLWDESHSWYTSKTTPFSGRLTVEKVSCGDDHEEHVRILVNDAPASTTQGSWCPTSTPDEHLCPLPTFLSQLSWVDNSDEWNRCYS